MESRPSFTHYPPVNCAHSAGGVCVCGRVCLSHTLTVIYSSSHTLPFCLLVSCHGEDGYNGRLCGTINLDTSYHCLPLQGEACPVANMINPSSSLLCNLLHTVAKLHPLSFSKEAPLQAKAGPPSLLRGKEPFRVAIPFRHRK